MMRNEPDAWRAIVELNRAKYATIAGFEVANAGYTRISGGYGIKGNNAQNIKIIGNKVHDTGRHGIAVSGDSIVIDGNEVYNTALRNRDAKTGTGYFDGRIATTFRDDIEWASTNITIRNNSVHNVWVECMAVVFKGGHG